MTERQFTVGETALREMLLDAIKSQAWHSTAAMMPHAVRAVDALLTSLSERDPEEPEDDYRAYVEANRSLIESPEEIARMRVSAEKHEAWNVIRLLDSHEALRAEFASWHRALKCGGSSSAPAETRRSHAELRDAFEAGIDAAPMVAANTRAQTERRVSAAFERYLAETPSKPKRVVHIAANGRALCEFVDALPSQWPEGHDWVTVYAGGHATCSDCLSGRKADASPAKETLKEPCLHRRRGWNASTDELVCKDCGIVIRPLTRDGR